MDIRDDEEKDKERSMHALENRDHAGLIEEYCFVGNFFSDYFLFYRHFLF